MVAVAVALLQALLCHLGFVGGEGGVVGAVEGGVGGGRGREEGLIVVVVAASRRGEWCDGAGGRDGYDCRAACSWGEVGCWEGGSEGAECCCRCCCEDGAHDECCDDEFAERRGRAVTIGKQRDFFFIDFLRWRGL